MTPASVYHNEINFNKNRKLSLSGHKLCQQNGRSRYRVKSKVYLHKDATSR